MLVHVQTIRTLSTGVCFLKKKVLQQSSVEERPKSTLLTFYGQHHELVNIIYKVLYLYIQVQSIAVYYCLWHFYWVILHVPSRLAPYCSFCSSRKSGLYQFCVQLFIFTGILEVKLYDPQFLWHVSPKKPLKLCVKIEHLQGYILKSLWKYKYVTTETTITHSVIVVSGYK